MPKDLDLTFDFSDISNSEVATEKDSKKENKETEKLDNEEETLLFDIGSEDTNSENEKKEVVEPTNMEQEDILDFDKFMLPEQDKEDIPQKNEKEKIKEYIDISSVWVQEEDIVKLDENIQDHEEIVEEEQSSNNMLDNEERVIDNNVVEEQEEMDIPQEINSELLEEELPNNYSNQDQTIENNVEVENDGDQDTEFIDKWNEIEQSEIENIDSEDIQENINHDDENITMEEVWSVEEKIEKMEDMLEEKGNDWEDHLETDNLIETGSSLDLSENIEVPSHNIEEWIQDLEKTNQELDISNQDDIKEERKTNEIEESWDLIFEEKSQNNQDLNNYDNEIQDVVGETISEEPIQKYETIYEREEIKDDVDTIIPQSSINPQNPIEENIDVNLNQISKVELWTQESERKKSKFQMKKVYIIWVVILVLIVVGYFLKDVLFPWNKPIQTNSNQQQDNQKNDEKSKPDTTVEWEKEETDDEQEEAKNKLLLEQKEKMEKAFPFYKVVSLSNTTFFDYLWENFNNVVSEKFEKILDPQVRESSVFLYQYKPQKLSNKKLISLLKKSVKWDQVAFKLVANIYWKLNKKVAWVEKKLKTDKGVKALNKLLIEQLNTNVPFVTSVNKELEAIANKSNNRLALFVYKNRIKDLRQTIVETKPSIQEVLSDDDFVYFEKWLSLPETKNYNIKQEQKMTEILLWALLQNERIVSVLKKTPDKIAKELDNSTVLRDAIDLTYKIDFYHKYLSDMLKINLEEN